MGDGKDPDYAGTWIVFGAVAEDVRDLGGKVKVRRGVVRCVGSYMQVVRYLHPGQLAWIAHAAMGAATSTGDGGAATSTGDRGAASSTGDGGAAVATGINSRAQAGPYGCVALAWWNTALDRAEMRCLEVGCGDGSDGKGKSGVWYRLDEATGAFVEESAA